MGRARWREAAAVRALDVGRAPGASGGSSGCCRYSCRLVQLLLRRRLLPSRWASGVARRGRTKAPLPLGVSQVSSSLRRRQGRGPRPAPARQPPAPPKPYLSAPGEDRGPRAGRGRRPGPARLFFSARGEAGSLRQASLSPSTLRSPELTSWQGSPCTQNTVWVLGEPEGLDFPHTHFPSSTFRQKGCAARRSGGPRASEDHLMTAATVGSCGFHEQGSAASVTT